MSEALVLYPVRGICAVLLKRRGAGLCGSSPVLVPACGSFSCRVAEHSVDKSGKPGGPVALCQADGLIADRAVRYCVHIIDLIDPHPQDLVDGWVETGDRAAGEMFDPGIQLCLSLNDPLQETLDEGFLHSAFSRAVVQGSPDQDIAECSVFLMRKKGKQDYLSLVLQCPSFFGCMYRSLFSV